MLSLRRDEAIARALAVRPDSYSVQLDLRDASGPHFDSLTTVRFAAEPGVTTFADVAPASLRGARLNGADLDLDSCFVDGRLTLAGLDETNELVVDAVMSYSHDGEGMHLHVDPADGKRYLYAMSFLDAAPRWFACFDQPDLKAPVQLEVRTPADWVVTGNGPGRQVERGVWQLRSHGPLASYFTTVVAGPYHQVRDEHDGIALSLLCRRSLARHLDRDAAELFAHTAACLDALHEMFATRYPWGEYHQAFVAEFNAGAMENPGCVTFRDDMVFRARVTDAQRVWRACTIAHEMAHMWFGDLVTMRWWDDLWLNESFAEYLGHRVCEQAGVAQPWVHFGAQRKSWGYAADRRPSTHPVAGNGAADARAALTEFDGISYAKGASVLRQLAVQLGDEVFLAGLRAYIGQHAHGNAELADLMAAWTAAGAQDLAAWSAAWLRSTGMDALGVDGTEVTRQGEQRMHAVAVAGYDSDGTQLWHERLTVSGPRTALTNADGAAALVLPDAGDETWCKVTLPAHAWASAGSALCGMNDPHARVALWNAVQLAVADAELAPAAALDIVVQAVPAESHDAIADPVGRWAITTLAGAYLGGRSAQARIAEALQPAVRAAGPGSGIQLAAAHLMIFGSVDVALLRRMLAGADLPDGLELDVELRWAILERLAELGALSAAQIEEAAQSDHSSQGEVHAMRCRAMRPDPAAKAAMWTTLMRDEQCPNYELYAIAEGFWRPGQEELTAPFVPRYFTEIGSTAQLRSGWVVNRIARLAYPWTAVDSATAAATEQMLAAPDLPAGIRRPVVDAGDDLQRALKARLRFAR